MVIQRYGCHSDLVLQIGCIRDSVDRLELCTNKGTKLGLRHGRVIETTFGAMDEFPLGTYDGSDV